MNPMKMTKSTEEFKKVYEDMRDDDVLKQEKAVMTYSLMKAWNISEEQAKESIEKLRLDIKYNDLLVFH